MESDFVLNGLLPSDGPTDVHIVEGEVAAKFPRPADENSYWSEGKDSFAFRVKHLGAFWITNGNNITVQSGDMSTDEELSLFILGTCMGALLIQRGLIPIHGSALSIHNKQFIITGNSGAGKSTLTASINKLGYSFLADDISALQIKDDGEAWILPAFPKQKLCGDTAYKILGSLDGLERIPGDRDKYHVPGIGQFITQSKQLHALFELSTHSDTYVEIEEVKGAERLAIIMRNTYRFQLVEVKGIEAKHFQQCTEIAKQIRVYRLKRPARGFTVEEQIRKIMNELEKI